MSEDNRSDAHLFIRENGAWLLTFFGLVTGCFSGLTMYFLKSRCSHIKLCCGAVDCVRDPLPPNQVALPATSVEIV